MIKTVFYTFLCLLFFGINEATHGQDVGTDRKGRFLFTLGPEFRVTPFYKYDAFTANQNNLSGFTNIDKQNSGTAINAGVEYFFTKNLSLGFSNSFRYDLVVGNFSDLEGPSFGDRSVTATDYKLLYDYSFYLAFYFRVFKKGEFFINVGSSFMNRNSDFSFKETQFDQNGNVEVERFSVADFNYSASKLVLGYKKRKTSIYLGLYTTILAPYFDTHTRFNVPFVGCAFNIGKL